MRSRPTTSSPSPAPAPAQAVLCFPSIVSHHHAYCAVIAIALVCAHLAVAAASVSPLSSAAGPTAIMSLSAEAFRQGVQRIADALPSLVRLTAPHQRASEEGRRRRSGDGAPLPGGGEERMEPEMRVHVRTRTRSGGGTSTDEHQHAQEEVRRSPEAQESTTVPAAESWTDVVRTHELLHNYSASDFEPRLDGRLVDLRHQRTSWQGRFPPTRFFLHMPKTGGTGFANVLASHESRRFFQAW
jgi:hypothetical protein